MNLLDDPEWLAPPTALECAHYDRLLQLQQSRSAQRAEEASAAARRIFGECLHTLVRLGMKEPKARTMLGKWRKAAGDDATLIAAINSASRANSPDPVAYVTAALKERSAAKNKVEARLSHDWSLVGWEAPHKLSRPDEPRWKHGKRGQVWRDPFGLLTILEAPEGVAIPTLSEDRGIDINSPGDTQ